MQAKVVIFQVTERPDYELATRAGPDRPIYVGSKGMAGAATDRAPYIPGSSRIPPAVIGPAIELGGSNIYSRIYKLGPILLFVILYGFVILGPIPETLGVGLYCGARGPTRPAPRAHRRPPPALCRTQLADFKRNVRGKARQSFSFSLPYCYPIIFISAQC